MVVFTRISFEDMAILAKELDIGTLHKFEDVLAGAENSSFKAYTSKGEWMVSLVERYHSPEHSNWQARLMLHLDRAGLPVPAPVLAKDGKIPFVKGKPLFVVPYIHGYHINVARASEDTSLLEACYKAGETLAQLHLTSESYPASFDNWITPAGIFKEWDRLEKTWKGKVPFHNQTTDDMDYVWEEGGKRVRSLEKEWASFLRSFERLPKCAIHADYFADNVIFSEGKLTAVIDFPYSCTDYQVYDLAIAISAWGFDKNIQWYQERVDRFTAGYERQRVLLPEEKEALNILCRFAAARFFVTRVCNLFEACKKGYHPKDPVDYLERLKFFEDNQNISTFRVDSL